MNGQAIQRGVQDNESVTVPSGTKVSNSFLTKGGAFGGFQLPATIDGTALTIEYSLDGVHWTSVPVASSNESNPMTVTANGSYTFPVNTFAMKFARFNFASDTQNQNVVIPLFFKG